MGAPVLINGTRYKGAKKWYSRSYLTLAMQRPNPSVPRYALPRMGLRGGLLGCNVEHGPIWQRFLGPAGLKHLCGTSLLVRLGWLGQFNEALAIAPNALGSAHRLIAKWRTPFSPRAHYKLSILF
jgi:hypothetical protein